MKFVLSQNGLYPSKQDSSDAKIFIIWFYLVRAGGSGSHCLFFFIFLSPKRAILLKIQYFCLSNSDHLHQATYREKHEKYFLYSD
jgi:hypothetical protein